MGPKRQMILFTQFTVTPTSAAAPTLLTYCMSLQPSDPQKILTIFIILGMYLTSSSNIQSAEPTTIYHTVNALGWQCGTEAYHSSQLLRRSTQLTLRATRIPKNQNDKCTHILLRTILDFQKEIPIITLQCSCSRMFAVLAESFAVTYVPRDLSQDFISLNVTSRNN